jgi:4,5-DOPA dioxygenase extradiol
MSTRTPVYFVSHGGPNVMFETEHPVYPQLQKIGREITQKIKPRAVVVFSAHWQAGRDKIEVNEAEVTSLIYEYSPPYIHIRQQLIVAGDSYYGFPDHYYKVQYPNVGSKDLAQKVLGLLKNAGIEAEGVKRGLDHGVFAPFTCSELRPCGGRKGKEG